MKSMCTSNSYSRKPVGRFSTNWAQFFDPSPDPYPILVSRRNVPKKRWCDEIEFLTGVFENLTSLRSFDLSCNKLSQLPSSNLLRLPHNLSVLNLSRNYFAKIPVKVLMKQKFSILDLRDNLLSLFSHELMKLIENGTSILFAGKEDFFCDLVNDFWIQAYS